MLCENCGESCTKFLLEGVGNGIFEKVKRLIDGLMNGSFVKGFAIIVLSLKIKIKI